LARTVLLADDSVTAQNMGRRILIDAGYEVVTVNNGSAALKRIHESRPDIVVLDVYMPGYGGLEVCQRLKESDETAKIPILLTVGKMEPFKAEEAKRVRADGHIIKPFEASELLAALTRLEDRIVPQTELSRGRKPKSEKEKKSKSSRSAFDPTMSYDDARSEKISYLEQVKQRHTGGERTEEAQNGFAESEEAPAQGVAPATQIEAPLVEPVPVPVSEGLKMPRPMSVYAAEALRELPVVAEPAQATFAEQPDFQEAPGFAQNDATETSAESTTSESVALTDQPAELATVADASAPSVDETRPEGAVLTQSESETSAADYGVDRPSTEAAAQTEVAPQSEWVEQTEAAASEAAQPAPAVAKSRWVAEIVAVSAEEAALELEREMQTQTVASSETGPEQSTSSVEVSGSGSSEGDAVPSTKPSETHGATFAAAAAASASGSEAVSNSFVSPRPDSEPQVPSEAAAAWENWQHIRDSVMGSQTAVHLSESEVQAVQSSATKTGVTGEANTDAARPSEAAQEAPTAERQAEEAESAALSSIVDTMLAELKPKLIAEISKKLKK
jgi:CheY-like chemotaxis protein